MRETCKLFIAGEYQTGRTDQQQIGQSDADNQILTFLWRIGNQEQARTVANQFASSVVSTRNHLVALVRATFTTRGTRAEIIPGRNVTENFRSFWISRKKDNHKRLTEIFETNFGNLSVQSDFEPEFPEILVEWNAPFAISLAFYVSFSSMDTRHQFCSLLHSCTSFRWNCNVHIKQVFHSQLFVVCALWSEK